MTVQKFNILELGIITARKRNCGKVKFSVVSVCRGRGVPCDHCLWCIGAHCTGTPIPSIHRPGTPLLSASDIWWSRLETSSLQNPPNRTWHLVEHFYLGAYGRRKWDVCILLEYLLVLNDIKCSGPVQVTAQESSRKRKNPLWLAFVMVIKSGPPFTPFILNNCLKYIKSEL